MNTERWNVDVIKRAIKVLAEAEVLEKTNSEYKLSRECQELIKRSSFEKEILRNSSKRFTPPTIDEVAAEIAIKKYDISAESFWYFYDSKDWFVGKNKMKSWKSALGRWQADKAKTTRHLDTVDEDWEKEVLKRRFRGVSNELL